MSLTYNCKLFINPSFFEGWSTTVEEAKALGSKIILSNIPVHIEQKNNRTLIFKSNDEKKLSKLIINCLNTPRRIKKLNILKKKYYLNKKKFQKDYLSLLNKN